MNEHLEDCERLVKILEESGYEGADVESVHRLWQAVSQTHAATWLILPVSDKEVLARIVHHYEWGGRSVPWS